MKQTFQVPFNFPFFSKNKNIRKAITKKNKMPLITMNLTQKLPSLNATNLRSFLWCGNNLMVLNSMKIFL
jgi:hypothetical protein